MHEEALHRVNSLPHLLPEKPLTSPESKREGLLEK